MITRNEMIQNSTVLMIINEMNVCASMSYKQTIKSMYICVSTTETLPPKSRGWALSNLCFIE